MPKHVKRVRTRVITLTMAAALGAGVAACAGDGGDDLPPPASPPPSAAPTPATTLDPEDAEAAEEILAAFDNYMEALIELSTEGVPGGTEQTTDRLEEVNVSSNAWLELRDDLLNENFLAGRVTSGTITWEASLLEIDWENTFRADPDVVVPEATLSVCFDETAWATVDKDSGEIVDGPGDRYLSAVTVTWRDEDPDLPELEPRWEVTVREDGTNPC